MKRFLKSIRRTYSDPEFRNVGLTVIGLIAVGTGFYSWVEGWSVLDALYFAVTTLATIGAGSMQPQTVAGKIFTILYIVIGIALFLALIQFTADEFLQRKREREDSDNDSSDPH